jgi:hypothetical protein
MISEDKQFICDHPDCDKLATRALSYSTKTSATRGSEFTSEVFCNRHAQIHMRSLQEEGLPLPCSGGGTKQAIVQDLSNESLEDDCYHQFATDHTLVVRVGKNADPTWYGYAPHRRGTTFVLNSATMASDARVIEKLLLQKKHRTT